MFWRRIENRKVICAACPLALGAWDSGTPIRPHKSTKSQPHYKLTSNNTPLKHNTGIFRKGNDINGLQRIWIGGIGAK